MQRDPQQELFTALKLNLEAKGMKVYDGVMPPANTPYPFVYIGSFQQTDREQKNAVIGSVFPTIHIWHNNPHQRGTVSQMMLEIKTTFRQLSHTENFSWTVRNVSTRILEDNTTKTPLLHGLIEAEFIFS